MTSQLQIERRDERRAVERYRGRFAWRVVAEFLVSLTLWVGVIVLGVTGTIPLWLGLLLNAVIATTFYMPLHEATHGNIWGAHRRGKWGQDLIGAISSVPLGFDYFAHRISHMHHHAFTNDPARDPDRYTDGPFRELPIAWWGSVLVQTLFPLIVFVPVSRRLLPAKVVGRIGFPDPYDPSAIAMGKASLRFWTVTHLALVAAFIFGFGWDALLLWYVPARLSVGWLQFVFAWFPHHPADRVGRYVDTRVAVFRGSTLLIRGHDHHALHHLFPRVPHYHLPALWQEIGPGLTAKGVRTEGRALGATGPIVW